MTHFNGGKYHLGGCHGEGYNPDSNAGRQAIAKGPGLHGRHSVDDGQVAVHTHQGHKQSPTVKSQLFRGEEVDTKCI